MMTTLEYAIKILDRFAIRAEQAENYDVCDAYARASDILCLVRDNNIGALDEWYKIVKENKE